jgi:hypothetical protein
MNKKLLVGAGVVAVLVAVSLYASLRNNQSSSAHAPEVAAFNAGASPSSIIATAPGAVSALQPSADARDATRISDLRTAQNDIELYFQVCASYPGGGGRNPGCTTVAPTDWPTLAKDIAAADSNAPVLPNDPEYPAQTYAYKSSGSYAGYTLTAQLEDQTNPALGSQSGSPNGISGVCGQSGLYCVTF